MTVNSPGLKVAESYLEDIEKNTDKIESIDNVFTSQRTASDLIKGDLALAFKEIEKAAAPGVEMSYARARAFLTKGRICDAVCNSISAQNELSYIGLYRKWKQQSIDAYKQSIQAKPSSMAYYELGSSYAAMRKKAEAIEAFKQVLNFNDELSLEATKEIGRLEQQKGGCYIATACYDDYNHPDVLVFRRYRDDFLMPFGFGRLCVKVYYMLSPPIAERLRHIHWLSRFIRRWFLEPLAKWLR